MFPKLQYHPRYKVLAVLWLVYGCYYLNRLNLAPVIPLMMRDLNLTHTQIGLISTAFFAFYTITQLPAGYLSDIFGPRKIIVAGGLLSSIANALFSAGTGLGFLIGLQSVNGLGQGCGFSPSIKLLNNWFPASERGRALGIFCTCTSVFTVLAYLLSGYVGHRFGWRIVFIMSPLIMVPGLVIFRLLVTDHPDGSGIIIEGHNPGEEPTGVSLQRKNRLFAVISNGPTRMACLGFSCLSYITYCNLIWLPSYLYEFHGLSVVSAGLCASIYPLMGIIARPLGGYLSDITFKGKRKPVILVGLFMILIFTALLALSDHLIIVLMLIAGVGFFDQTIGTLFFALELDILSPDLTGTASGFLEAGGHLGSMCAMFLTGILIDTFGSYVSVFFLLSFLAALGIFAVLLIPENKQQTYGFS